MKPTQIVVLLIFAVVLGTGSMLLLMQSGVIPPAQAQSVEKEFVAQPMEILTNLATPYHYVRAKVAVGTSSKRALKDIEEKAVIIRDVCIMEFNNATIGELGHTDSINQFKERLKNKIEEKCGIPVSNIYFVEFATQ